MNNVLILVKYGNRVMQRGPQVVNSGAIINNVYSINTALDKYNTSVSNHYEESVDGNFEDANTSILSDLVSNSDTDQSETDEEEV